MRRLLILITLLGGALGAQAGTLAVHVAGKGPFKVWISSGAPAAPSASAKSGPGPDFELDNSDGDHLAVLDDGTGNLASIALKPGTKAVAVAKDDFKLIGSAHLRFESAGGAGQQIHANVTLGGQMIQVFGDGQGQSITLYAIKPGSILSVAQVVDGKQLDPVQQIISLKLDRADPIPTVTVALPSVPGVKSGDTPTPAPGATDRESGSALPAPAAKAKPPSIGTLAGKLAVMILGLVGAGAVIYLLFYLWKRDPDAISQKLTSLGVQIPKDPNSDPDPSPVQPMAPVAPAPIQKIVLPDSDPTPLAMPTPIASPLTAAPTTFSDAPRLVRENGEELTIKEGVTTVGREAGLGLSLVDQSTLSRRHAELIRQGASIGLKDLGSTNGTFVNGRRLDAETSLKPGDEVQFGAVRFRVEA